MVQFAKVSEAFNHEEKGEIMTLTEQIELKASELILELERIGQYGIGQFAGVLVERRPELAEALKISIEVNQEELNHDN